jgi:hypothetical protein
MEKKKRVHHGISKPFTAREWQRQGSMHMRRGVYLLILQEDGCAFLVSPYALEQLRVLEVTCVCPVITQA